jgi:hypothetical protein
MGAKIRSLPTKQQQPERRCLKQCIDRCTEAARKVQIAEDSIQRAQAWLERKQAALAQHYGGVDEALAQQRLEIEKHFLASGGAARRSVSPDLIEKVREKDQIQKDITAAGEAIESLSADLAEARSDLSAANAECSRAAAAILIEHAKREAAQLRAAQEAVWRLSASIRGLGRLWLPDNTGGAMRPISLPMEVLSSLDRPEPATVPANNPETLAAAKFRAWHLSLQTDPDVSFQDGAQADEKANVA